MPLIVAVTGSGSGVGESILRTALTRALTDEGRRVDEFREEEILERPAFDQVATRFKATGRVEQAALLRAAKRYVDDLAASGFDVAVVDSALPYVFSLIAWGYGDEDIRSFIRHLGDVLAQAKVVQLHLVGDVAAALSRAIDREDVGWLEHSIRKTSRYDNLAFEVTSRADLERFLQYAADRTVKLPHDAQWPVHVIDADRPLATVSEDALRIVRDALQ